MLSIFVDKSSLAAIRSYINSHSQLNQAIERLGTGKRLNRASDDAAGLQIASRLAKQVSGMKVAQKNIATGVSLIQIAGSTLDEYSTILLRMKDLAVQAANDTHSKQDLRSIQKVFFELKKSAVALLHGASFGGARLFHQPGDNNAPNEEKGLLTRKQGLTLQIGESTAATMNINVNEAMEKTEQALSRAGKAFGLDDQGQTDDITGDRARQALALLNEALDEVSQMRGLLGAKQNRLGYAASNLQNMHDNLVSGLGNIKDTDYTTELSRMSGSRILAQNSISILKQADAMRSMVWLLLAPDLPDDEAASGEEADSATCFSSNLLQKNALLPGDKNSRDSGPLSGGYILHPGPDRSVGQVGYRFFSTCQTSGWHSGNYVSRDFAPWTIHNDLFNSSVSIYTRWSGLYPPFVYQAGGESGLFSGIVKPETR
ncbi:flagellin [Intestinirhabdus alba]|jgi:flagellin|uniref:Flagellin n=1 Tax=Intestinirhabdus alba TaxID=2899544 RepID=A0A6L6IHB9_9ENTR|nr:flagellin [Intestinirhabdus alba]MTH46262.1 hypothetical protein [Intestinirhabdus alba]